MVVLLCLAYGVVNVDLLGINYLLPFIKPSLALTNGQVGMLLAGFWTACAAGSWIGGAQIDKARHPKRLLAVLLAVFAVVSPISGLTAGFGELLGARILMGAIEGPIAALLLSMVASGSTDARRGFNVAVVQSLGSSILGATVAPIVLVSVARTYGWRFGFFTVAVPALACAALVGYFLPEPRRADDLSHGAHGKRAASDGARGVLATITSRNVIWCAFGAAFDAGFVWIVMGFLPLFYVGTRHVSTQSMSFIMALLGVSSTVLCIGLPLISDRLGRKPVLLVASIMGLLLPVIALEAHGSITLIAVLLAVTWAPVGLTSLFWATIPAESVAPQSIATAIGFISAFGTFVGGVVAPSLAGWSADRWGPRAPLMLALLYVVGIVVAAVMIREPHRVARDPSLAAANQQA